MKTSSRPLENSLPASGVANRRGGGGEERGLVGGRARLASSQNHTFDFNAAQQPLQSSSIKPNKPFPPSNMLFRASQLTPLNPTIEIISPCKPAQPEPAPDNRILSRPTSGISRTTPPALPMISRHRPALSGRLENLGIPPNQPNPPKENPAAPFLLCVSALNTSLPFHNSPFAPPPIQC